MTENTAPVIERELSADQAIELLEAAVATRGAEYNYRFTAQEGSGATCLYIRNGEPSCLVGVALVTEGVPIEVLTYIDEFTHDCENECLEDCTESSIGSIWAGQVLRDRAGLMLSDEARWVLSSAQIYQDTGRTWGEALEAAKRALEEGCEQRPGI